MIFDPAFFCAEIVSPVAAMTQSRGGNGTSRACANHFRVVK
jgi:hypothetical protein